MADTSWGFNIQPLAPSIGEAVQMGEQKRQRDLIESQRAEQKAQDDLYKRMNMIDQAANAKDFLTDNAKVDAMVNQRLAEIKRKFSSPEFAKMPVNVLYGQLQQELAPLMVGATSFKGSLAAQKDAIAKLAKANPNLDVESLTADVRDVMTSDVLMQGPDGSINFKPVESWKYANMDLAGQLTSQRDYFLSSAPFTERLKKEKSRPFPVLMQRGGDYISGGGTMTDYHELDGKPNEYGIYAKEPQLRIRGEERYGRRIAKPEDLDKFESQGTLAETSGFRKAWSEYKDRYKAELPYATEDERKRAMLYDMMQSNLPGDIGGTKSVSRAPGTTRFNVNAGGAGDGVYWDDIAKEVDDLLSVAKNTGGSVPFKDIPAEAQTIIREKVKANESLKDLPDENIALVYDENGVPWVSAYVIEYDASGNDVSRWQNKIKYDRGWINVKGNKTFGQKATIAAGKASDGNPPKPTQKPKEGGGALN